MSQRWESWRAFLQKRKEATPGGTCQAGRQVCELPDAYKSHSRIPPLRRPFTTIGNWCLIFVTPSRSMMTSVADILGDAMGGHCSRFRAARYRGQVCRHSLCTRAGPSHLLVSVLGMQCMVIEYAPVGYEPARCKFHGDGSGRQRTLSLISWSIKRPLPAWGLHAPG